MTRRKRTNYSGAFWAIALTATGVFAVLMVITTPSGQAVLQPHATVPPTRSPRTSRRQLAPDDLYISLPTGWSIATISELRGPYDCRTYTISDPLNLAALEIEPFCAEGGWSGHPPPCSPEYTRIGANIYRRWNPDGYLEYVTANAYGCLEHFILHTPGGAEIIYIRGYYANPDRASEYIRQLDQIVLSLSGTP